MMKRPILGNLRSLVKKKIRQYSLEALFELEIVSNDLYHVLVVAKSCGFTGGLNNALLKSNENIY